MLDRRIAYSKDKGDVIKRLVAAEEGTGPFARIADALVFCAALGLRRGGRVKLAEPLAEPIRQEVFERQGYSAVMALIALYGEERPEILSDDDNGVETRAIVFEEFANGGLELLRSELKGAVDVLETLLLIIGSERRTEATAAVGVDLTSLISS